MGGRGKGHAALGGGSGGGSDYAATVQISYNPDRTARPYSIAGAWDSSAPGGQSPWATDARNRPKTFATEHAAADYARRNASGPVRVERFTKEGQHYPQGSDGRAIQRPGHD